MGQTTAIEWADSTCNPVMGCDGCELHRKDSLGFLAESHCYAAGLVNHYAGLPGWPASFDKPELFLHRIKAALKWPDLTGKERPDKPWLSGKPRHIFWCDLSDPWTKSLPLDWLAPYLNLLAVSPHIHIFCTKQPQRAREFFEQYKAPKNLILLTTVTSAATLWRAEELLRVPGISVRGSSLEPILGQVDLEPWMGWTGKGSGLPEPLAGTLERLSDVPPELDWVIVGGESGPGARPMHPDWARSVRDQCRAAGVPFFMKQITERGRKIPFNQWPTDLQVRQMPDAIQRS